MIINDILKHNNSLLSSLAPLTYAAEEDDRPDDAFGIAGTGSGRVIADASPGTNADAGRDITIVLQLDGREFARGVYRANNEEAQRVGVRLDGGGR